MTCSSRINLITNLREGPLDIRVKRKKVVVTQPVQVGIQARSPIVKR